MENSSDGEAPPLSIAALEKLAPVPSCTWFDNVAPFHNSYGHWLYLGLQHVSDSEPSSAYSSAASSSESSVSISTLPSPPAYDPKTYWRKLSQEKTDLENDPMVNWRPVMARVSSQTLRVEREYNNNQRMARILGRKGDLVLRQYQLVRPEGSRNFSVIVVHESLGPNDLQGMMYFGQAYFGGKGLFGRNESVSLGQAPVQALTSVDDFLNFAIGACECLELLHNGIGEIHGELRPDAFHFTKRLRRVKIVNGGNGPKSFENLLSTTEWASSSKELGAQHKLQFMAPEQTSRLPAEPDNRTDIFSLGVIFYVLLTGVSPYTADAKPIEIVQMVLNNKVPLVISKRPEIPRVISDIIQKMTQKRMHDRYSSIVGLKHDLLAAAKLLEDDDTDGLSNFVTGQKDISSFFRLSQETFGRSEEISRIVNTLQQASIRQTVQIHGSDPHPRSNFSSNGSISDTKSVSSAGKIGHNGLESSSGSGTVLSLKKYKSHGQANDLAESETSSGNRFAKLLSAENANIQSMRRRSVGSRAAARLSTSPLRHVGEAERCETIITVGEAGIGKSHLMRAVQPLIQQFGRFSYGRFDRIQSSPFEPIIKTLATLLTQILADPSNPSNERVRRRLRQSWHYLHHILGISKDLLDNYANSRVPPPEPARRPSTLPKSVNMHSGQSTHFDANGLPVQHLQFQKLLLLTFRAVARSEKLLVVCFEDLQEADKECIAFLIKLSRSNIPLALLLTMQSKHDQNNAMTSLIRSDEWQTIQLRPLKEHDVLEYVSSTFHRDPSTMMGLAATVYANSKGCPLHIRGILTTCHRNGLVWFDWRTSSWQFDCGRIKAELGIVDTTSLTKYFIERRLRDKSATAQSMILWASVMGESFSFSALRRLLCERIQQEQCHIKSHAWKEILLTQSKPIELLESLQALLSASVIIPGQSDDEFVFSWDGSSRAAQMILDPEDLREMHFVIVHVSLSDFDLDGNTLYRLCHHIGACRDLIKQRIPRRSWIRNLLIRGAKLGIEKGANSNTVSFFDSCLDLLQVNPWDEIHPDVNYEETFELYMQAADAIHQQGDIKRGMALVIQACSRARNQVDSAHALILRSRLLSKDDPAAAYQLLLDYLKGTGLSITETNWEELDTNLETLKAQLRMTQMHELLAMAPMSDPDALATSLVIGEAIHYAFNTDSPLLYPMAFKLVKSHIKYGSHAQIGFGYYYLCAVSIARLADMEWSLSLTGIAEALLKDDKDSWTRVRAFSLRMLLVGHLQTPIQDLIPALEVAQSSALDTGDINATCITTVAVNLYRFYSGIPMDELESYCPSAVEELEKAHININCVFVDNFVRQTARALQGKTYIGLPDTIFDDEIYNTQHLLASHTFNSMPKRGLKARHFVAALMPLYLFGHYETVVKIMKERIGRPRHIWSLRHLASGKFYLSLSLLALARNDPDVESQKVTLETVRAHKNTIDEWVKINDANYGMYSLMLQAELEGFETSRPELYEAAVDHAHANNFHIEEALALELQAESFMRQGAKRAAKLILQESIGAWARIKAFGKVNYLVQKHQNLTLIHTHQLDEGLFRRDEDTLEDDSEDVDDVDVVIPEPNAEHLRSWLKPGASAPTEKTLTKLTSLSLDTPALGLDVLDLSSILESNQVISSEIEIKKLLRKIVIVFLKSVSGQADHVAIVERTDEGCIIAATTNEEGQVEIYGERDFINDPRLMLCHQICNTALRTGETIFTPNVNDDSRFSKIAEEYTKSTQYGRSAISIPMHRSDQGLLGAIYLEGPPDSFTERSLAVLDILTKQAAISFMNAQLHEEVNSISELNKSMLESQKEAARVAKEAEIKARKAEAEATEASRAKSIFLANVSHELRTPLNGVIGMSELLRGTSLSSEQENYIGSIRVCGETLLTVINDILDFSRLDTGNLQMSKQAFNVKTTIVDVVRALMGSSHGLQIIQKLDLQDDLIVFGDRVRLMQIFMNLLSNSYKFTDSGSVSVGAMVVDQGNKSNNETVVVKSFVRDTGLGITEEQLKRLFRPFSQADSSTARTHGGSGLGLSICKAIVEKAFNGKIWIDSDYGVGTTVWFTLELERYSEKKAKKEEKEAGTKAPRNASRTEHKVDHAKTNPTELPRLLKLAQTPTSSLRICIAEDNTINQRILLAFVKNNLRLKVEAFFDGKQAWDALENAAEKTPHEPFHVVLMDIQMPVLDGYEATRAIRQSKNPLVRDVLIVAVTASAHPGDMERCLEVGMDAYTVKPVKFGSLKTCLGKYIKLH